MLEAGDERRPLARDAALAVEREDVEGEVRAVEAGAHALGFPEAEPRDDLLRDLRRRGRGAGHRRRVAELADDRGEAQVVGAEVVAPLGHAVRLVDDEQRDRRAARSRCGRRSRRSARARRRRPCACAAADAVERLLVVRAAGEHHRGVAEVGQARALVAHERDQRRDDDGQIVAGERRQLVAEALAAAGRHDDERVAPLERGRRSPRAGRAGRWRARAAQSSDSGVASPAGRGAGAGREAGGRRGRGSRARATDRRERGLRGRVEAERRLRRRVARDGGESVAVAAGADCGERAAARAGRAAASPRGRWRAAPRPARWRGAEPAATAAARRRRGRRRGGVRRAATRRAARRCAAATRRRRAARLGRGGLDHSDSPSSAAPAGPATPSTRPGLRPAPPATRSAASFASGVSAARSSTRELAPAGAQLRRARARRSRGRRTRRPGASGRGS